METPKPKPQVIVAMKGHPGTGKSTIAAAIATALRCSLIDKDDIRDATLSLSSNATSSALNDLSYAAMWCVASTQLRAGLSVVLDSPLSRHGHLDSVLKLAGDNHKVVIVECRPSNEAEWRRRVEVRGAEDGGGGHKPATWQDMKRLLEGYDGCTEYDVGEVPKLIVDTTATITNSGGSRTSNDGIHKITDPVSSCAILSTVIEFIHSHCGGIDYRS